MISAVLWLGTPHRIIELAERNRLVICMTQAMLDELREVLSRQKFKSHLEMRRTSTEEILSALIPLIELYAPTKLTNLRLSDPDDEMFVACAVSANADYIVSGDDHLLRMKQYGKIKILNPSSFVHAVEMNSA